MSLRQASLGAAGALAFSVAAVPAAAQVEQPFSIDESRATLSAFAQCNVRKNPALAREFILSNRHYAIDDRFRKLILPECLGEAMQGMMLSVARLQFTAPVLWYTIADTLVSRDLQRFDPNIVRTAEPLPEIVVDPSTTVTAKGHVATPAETAKNLAAAQNDLALVRYGECVVRADPLGSQNLLASKVNSNEEGARLIALLPAFRACLDKGQRFGASRLVLRGVIAFNFYRLAYAPKRP